MLIGTKYLPVGITGWVRGWAYGDTTRGHIAMPPTRAWLLEVLVRVHRFSDSHMSSVPRLIKCNVLADGKVFIQVRCGDEVVYVNQL